MGEARAVQTTEPTTRRGLVRRSSDRWIAGVAGGLADATGTSAAWWRVGFVALTLLGGAGVTIYVILWIVIPRADLPRSAGQRIVGAVPGIPAWVALALLVLGAFLLIGRFFPIGLIPWSLRPTLSDLFPFAGKLRASSPGFALAILLIGVGILLFRRGEETEPGGSVGVVEVPLAELPTAELPPPPRAARAPRAPRRRRQRSVTGWLGFGLALAAVGVGWYLVDTGRADLSVSQVLSLALVVLGVGLLVGSLFGRARWTIVPGLLLLPAVLVVSVIPTPITGRYDTRYERPHAATQVRSTYEQSGGTLVLDLTHVPSGDPIEPIQATLGVGTLQVIVPAGTPVDISAEVGIGSISMLGTEIGGVGVTRELHRGSDPIVMTLHTGIGTIEVYEEGVVAKPQPPATPKPKHHRHANAGANG